MLPYHRKRAFPGRKGRHRPRFPIDDDASYESGAEERHVDFAARYSRAVNRLDFGLTAFAGTSREPSFPPGLQVAGRPLVPHYEQIRQYGLDAQFTTDPWLYKVEAAYRSGARNLLGRKEDYSALVLGVERTFAALFGSRADLTFLAEWHHDRRARRATTPWANDVFVMGVLALNDVQGTELAAGLLGDLRYDTRALNLELKRRLSDRWTMRLEGIATLSSDPQDLTYDGRRDSFLGVDFSYGF